MKIQKILFATIIFTLFSGCSVSLPGNPDQENFDQSYDEPDFSAEEERVLNGENF